MLIYIVLFFFVLANHLQSPRSLFLDSNSRDTLSSRRPSFNASIITNAADRASPLSSPFYSGNITFGGASAAGLYKRNRNIFNNSNEVCISIVFEKRSNLSRFKQKLFVDIMSCTGLYIHFRYNLEYQGGQMLKLNLLMQ